MGQSCCGGKSKVNAGFDYSSIVDLAYTTGCNIYELRDRYHQFIKEYPNGHVTKKQFLQLYQTYFAGNKPEAPEQARQIFKTFDQNQDGTIDFREFMIAISILSQGTMAQKLTAAFEFYDENGDGVLTYDEIQNIVTMIYHVARSRGNIVGLPEPKVFAKQIFEQLDEDKNGEITLEEFINVGSEDKTMADLLLSHADEVKAWE